MKINHSRKCRLHISSSLICTSSVHVDTIIRVISVSVTLNKKSSIHPSQQSSRKSLRQETTLVSLNRCDAPQTQSTHVSLLSPELRA